MIVAEMSWVHQHCQDFCGNEGKNAEAQVHKETRLQFRVQNIHVQIRAHENSNEYIEELKLGGLPQVSGPLNRFVQSLATFGCQNCTNKEKLIYGENDTEEKNEEEWKVNSLLIEMLQRLNRALFYVKGTLVSTDGKKM